MLETQAFFVQYRDAFNRGDGDAVADLWHTPSAITDVRDGAARVTWWSDEAPMRENMRSLAHVYGEAGPHRWDFELLEHVPLGALHAFAHVRWTMSRPDGGVMQRFATAYQLARLPAGPRALMCTAYQEDLNEAKRHAAQ